MKMRKLFAYATRPNNLEFDFDTVTNLHTLLRHGWGTAVLSQSLLTRLVTNAAALLLLFYTLMSLLAADGVEKICV